MSLALKPMRVGRKKFVDSLRNPTSLHIREIIQQNFMYDEETQKTLARYFSVVYKMIACFNMIINDFLDIARANFEAKNDEYMRIEAICCRVKDPLRCGTCLGKKPLHFPYIYVSKKTQPQDWKEIKVKDWREFFKENGLNDKQIDILFEAIERRALTLQMLFNHSIQWLYHIGATDKTV